MMSDNRLFEIVAPACESKPWFCQKYRPPMRSAMN
jgi:hypothetical protein